MELLKINKKQKDKLLELGVEVTNDTLVLEILKLSRSTFHPLGGPHYVNVHLSAYYVSEVHGYLTITEKETNSGKRWYSYGTNSWEQAESLALDYILGIYTIGN